MTKVIRGRAEIENLRGGYDGLVEESGTSFTLSLNHLFKFTRATNGSAIAVTLPADLPLRNGDWFQVIQGGAGAVTITGASGVTVNGADAGSKATSAAYGSLHVRKIADEEYIIL